MARELIAFTEYVARDADAMAVIMADRLRHSTIQGYRVVSAHHHNGGPKDRVRIPHFGHDSLCLVPGLTTPCRHGFTHGQTEYENLWRSFGWTLVVEGEPVLYELLGTYKIGYTIDKTRLIVCGITDPTDLRFEAKRMEP